MASKFPTRGLLRPTAATLAHPATAPFHATTTTSSSSALLLPLTNATNPASIAALSSSSHFSTTSSVSQMNFGRPGSSSGGYTQFNWQRNPPIKRKYRDNSKRLARSKARKPGRGERKAFRKRIVLSNNSALAVEGLPELDSNMLLRTPERDLILRDAEFAGSLKGFVASPAPVAPPLSRSTVNGQALELPSSPYGSNTVSSSTSISYSDPLEKMAALAVDPNNMSMPVDRRKSLVKIAQGMVSLPGPLCDRLRLLEVFKPTQTWSLFRRPHFLIREETTHLVQKIKTAVDNKAMVRIVIEGGKATGKSLLLLQAVSYALLNDWAIIHIPEAQELVNGNTEYTPIPNTSPMQFAQNVYVTRLIERIYEANETLFRKLLITRPYRTELVYIPMGSTLADLCTATRDDDSSWGLFLHIWHELTTVPGRPPILFSADGIAHFMRSSAYRDPKFNIVHAHEMSLPRLFLSALSPTGYGAAAPLTFANGGAILGTAGGNNSPRIVALELALRQGFAITQGKSEEEIPQRDPFERGYDERVFDALRGVDVMRVGGVSRDEARAVLEYWAASGLLRTSVTERVVAEKWTLGGSGILGEIERTTLLNMRIPWL